MWVWVAVLGLLLLGAQLYDWWLQTALPLWFSGLAGLGLAIVSNRQLIKSTAPVPRSVPSSESEIASDAPANSSSPDRSASISFTINTPTSR